MMLRLMTLQLSMLCAIGLCAAVATGAAAQPAAAQGVSAQPADTLSAASRNRKRHHSRHSSAHAPIPYAAPRYYGRGGGDPSFGPDGRPYRPPANLGSCVYDEGYGRFSACPND